MAKEVERAPDRGVTVYERLNRVKAEVARVPKTGTNTHFNYKFATDADVIDTIRPLCAKHGVCVVFMGTKPEWISIVPGEKQDMHRVWVQYDVVNTDDPTDRFTVMAIGEALDGQDKGFNKALTAAAKYLFLKLFDVSTGDSAVDPDHGDGVEKDARRPAAPPEKKIAVLGESGRVKLAAKMKACGLTLPKLRQALYIRGWKDAIRGNEEKPELWPADMIEDLVLIFDEHAPKVAEPKAEPKNLRLAVLEELKRRWPEAMKGVVPPAGGPKNPEEMLLAMEDSKDYGLGDTDTRYTVMLSDLEEGNVMFPAGDTIPF